MGYIGEGFAKALFLILSLDRELELLAIIFLSLTVSGSALFCAAVTGIPFGAFMGLKKFPGRSFTISIMNTFMGLPPVVVGLFVYLILSRRGPLGFMALLYTPSAMVIAQLILAFPIVTALSHSAIANVDPVIRQASMSLGATPMQTTINIIREARYGIFAALIAGFGRVMALYQSNDHNYSTRNGQGEFRTCPRPRHYTSPYILHR